MVSNYPPLWKPLLMAPIICPPLSITTRQLTVHLPLNRQNTPDCIIYYFRTHSLQQCPTSTICLRIQNIRTYQPPTPPWLTRYIYLRAGSHHHQHQKTRLTHPLAWCCHRALRDKSTSQPRAVGYHLAKRRKYNQFYKMAKFMAKLFHFDSFSFNFWPIPHPTRSVQILPVCQKSRTNRLGDGVSLLMCSRGSLSQPLDSIRWGKVQNRNRTRRISIFRIAALAGTLTAYVFEIYWLNVANKQTMSKPMKLEWSS